MKIAIFSDPHHGLAKNSAIYHKIALDFYDWFKDVCDNNKIDLIVVAGDIFHDRMEINLPTLKNASDCFSKLINYPIKMITGNHDSFFLEHSEIHSLELFKNWPNVDVIDQIEYVMLGDKKIGFIPWVGKTYKNDIEICDAAIVHMELIGFEMNGIVASNGTSPTIFKECPLVISGHFHKFQDKKLKNTRVYYTGSPYQHNWGELEDKYIHILDTESMELTKIENTVSPKHYYIHTEADFENIKGNFVKVLIDSDETQNKFKSLFETELPLDCVFERKIDEKIQNELITDFKNVEIFPIIVEFISNMNEDDSIKTELISKNLLLYEQANQ